MKEELKKILSLLEEGAINKEQAEQLIDALNDTNKEKASHAEPEKPRKFLVHITDENSRKFDITLPISWVSFGLKFISDHDQFMRVGGKSIPIDKKLLAEAISNPDFRGLLVDIQENHNHIKVEVV